MNEFVKGHEIKLKGVTKSSSVPFTHKDTVVNITALFNEVMDITKTGLGSIVSVVCSFVKPQGWSPIG